MSNNLRARAPSDAFAPARPLARTLTQCKHVPRTHPHARVYSVWGELKVQKDRYEFRTDEKSREQRARVRAEEVKTAFTTPLSGLVTKEYSVKTLFRGILRSVLVSNRRAHGNMMKAWRDCLPRHCGLVAILQLD
eukprot:6180926-Pleurochrysis_carterae.AAC.1